MPDREFRTIGDVGPIRAPADANGVIDWPSAGGGSTTTTAATVAGWAEPTPLDAPITIADPSFGFTAPQIAAATRARISAKFGSAYYGYAPLEDPDAMHPLPINETVVIDGSQNISNLRFFADTGTPMIVVTLEAPEA